MKALLHVCCAPCSVPAVKKLEIKHDLSLFFYNPNIHPEEEYLLRLSESERYIKKMGLSIIAGPYEPDVWLERAAGMESDEEGGLRCEECCRMRIDKTARKAVEMGISRIAATISTGPRKKAETINSIGRETAENHGIVFLEEDFKKKDGGRISTEACREHGIYRQQYCGCVFSFRQRKD